MKFENWVCVYIVNKENDSSDEWSLCVVYKSRITVSDQHNVDQSVTGCINLALVADEQVRNW